MGVLKPDLILMSVVPVIMAGILGVYGLIVGVILAQKSNVWLLIDLLNSYKKWLYMVYGILTFSFRIMLRFIIISKFL